MAKKLIQVVYQVNDTGLIKAEATIKSNEKAANDADKAVKRYGQDAKKAGDDASKSFSNLGNVWKGLIAIGIVSFIGSLAKKTFELGVQQEQLNIAFSTFLGSAEKAKKLIGELTKFAIVTPFTPDQVNKAAKALLSFGVAGEDIIPTLKILGDVSAGTGKDLGEMAIIFGQIRSTGRLMGQDLLQLINAGFNPLQVISQETGKSVKTLKEEMEKGLITFDMVAGAFKTATSEGGLFFNLMEKQSQSVGGLLSTISGNLDEVLKNIFTANTGLVKNFVDLLVQASNGLLAFSETAEQALDRINAAIKDEFKKNFDDLVKTTGSLAEAEAVMTKTLNEQYDVLSDNLKLIQSASDVDKELQAQTLQEINAKRQQIIALQEYVQAIKDEQKAKETADLQKKLETETKAREANAKALKKQAEEYHKYAEEISKQVAQENPITEGFGIDNLINGMGFLTAEQRKTLEDDTKAMLKRMDDAAAASAATRVAIELAAAEQESQIRQAAFDFSISLIGQALSASLSAEQEDTDAQRDEFDKRIELAGDNTEQVRQIRQEQDKFEEESRKRAAEKDKEVQLKQMIVTSLQNALRALGTPPVPNFALAGLTAAFGAASIGVARGIGFKEGVIGLEGPGSGTSDSIPARLSRGESVITAAATSRSFNLLEAINSGAIDDRILNKVSKGFEMQMERFDDSRLLESVDRLAARSSYEEGHFTVNRVQRSRTLTTHIKSKFRS